MRDRVGLVVGEDVDVPVGQVDGGGADVLGPMPAQPAALDHRGPAHAQVDLGGRDDEVAHPRQGRVARERPPRHDGDQWHPPPQPSQRRERLHPQPDRRRPVRVARPSAAALREEDERHTATLRQLDEPIRLLVVARALRARQHRVVVAHDDDLAPLDGRGPAQQPIARGPPDQLLHTAPLRLRGDDERPVLHEAAGIDEVRDVLPRRPPPARPD